MELSDCTGVRAIGEPQFVRLCFSLRSRDRLFTVDDQSPINRSASTPDKMSRGSVEVSHTVQSLALFAAIAGAQLWLEAERMSR